MDGFAWRVRSACGNIFLSALPACSLSPSAKALFADDDKEAGSQTNSKQVKKETSINHFLALLFDRKQKRTPRLSIDGFTSTESGMVTAVI